MSFDPITVETIQNAVRDLNKRYAKGTKRWRVDGNNAGPCILDTQTGKTYGFFFIPQAWADAEKTPTIYGPKGKPPTSKKERDKLMLRVKAQGGMKHDTFDEDDLNEFLEHYGVLGMKWGVRKDTPQQLRRGIKKLDRKRRRAAKRYYKVESNKRELPYSKYIKKSYKAAKRLDKRERKLMDFMEANLELFNQSQSYLNGKQADIGRKWLEIASANPDDRFWMIMGERARQVRSKKG